MPKIHMIPSNLVRSLMSTKVVYYGDAAIDRCEALEVGEVAKEYPMDGLAIALFNFSEIERFYVMPMSRNLYYESQILSTRNFHPELHDAFQKNILVYQGIDFNFYEISPNVWMQVIATDKFYEQVQKQKLVAHYRVKLALSQQTMLRLTANMTAAATARVIEKIIPVPTEPSFEFKLAEAGVQIIMIASIAKWAITNDGWWEPICALIAAILQFILQRLRGWSVFADIPKEKT